jgi:CubicO group peptidase (beta-lactamase class C family)
LVTARELGRFYEMLLAGGTLAGARVLGSDTVECLTARALEGANDRIFRVRLDRGLGFVLDSKAYGLGSAWYGTRGSGRAFGHGGYFSSVGFADPGRGLAVALAYNGIIEPPRHDLRLREAIDALYEDLGW